ncbi:DNA-directed RNA polymerase subunit G [Acidianus manzaensis]|uniref:DNA-directed RNA polymerase subunit Rpo8 n=1 Tax=Acidianus manzaensis TaxID=282676 RepID=A0A1W6K038_9CREN|nr:DNA-directed RNA polymerase subunit G [Acidianus manzaensis]ARM75886.1 DNA-directed RNA polymerase subunit G [Acidianus manzaensis]
MQSNTTEFKEDGIVNSIEAGALRDLYIVKINTDNINISLDVTRQINIFNKDEKVTIIISRTRPNFTDNDFCGQGYIVTEKKSDHGYVTIISLYGLIVRIESQQSFINKYGFNIMDHVYFCAIKS